MSEQTLQIILVVNLLVGVLMCFAGYAIWRFLCYVLCAVFSLCLTLVLSIMITCVIIFVFKGPLPDNRPIISSFPIFWFIVIIVEIVELLLLAWLMYIMENKRKTSGRKSFFAGIIPLCTFFLAGILGFFDSLNFASLLKANNETSIIVGVICGVFIGIIVVLTEADGIIVFSSLMGGVSLMSSIFPLATAGKSPWLMLGLGLIIGIVGMIVQFGAVPKILSFLGNPSGDRSIDEKKPGFTKDGNKTGKVSSNIAERLKQLTDLRNEGLISSEDYEKKKAEILKQL